MLVVCATASQRLSIMNNHNRQAMIQVSAQYGDPSSAVIVRPFHKSLNEAFEMPGDQKYFRSIEKLTIVLRVFGTLWRFPGEGPDKVKVLKQKREVTVDLMIPEERWKSVPLAQLRDYLDKQVRKCFQELLDNARKAGELDDEIGLVRYFEEAMTKFSRNAA